MRIFQTLLLSLIAASLLPGHPMGNFSVNHYARFDFSPRSVKLTYILDLAEIPTLELMQQLKLENAHDPHVTARVATQAREWVKNLQLSENGAAVRPHIESIASRMLDGAAGMQVMRVVMTADLPARPGSLRYEDRNYPGRAGWKEIVITGSDGVAFQNPAQGREDRSHALEVYPSDATAAPPQDLSAAVSWSAPAAPHAERRPQPGQQISPAGEAPPPAVAPQRPFVPQEQPAGTVVQGDYLSRMLKNTEITWGMAAIGVLFAFCLGAMHALSPGHGKTIVAAYLVGTRGTLKHAMFLGGMVTFTHTVSVFALGLGVLLFQQYVVPERIIPVLGAISGISIVCIGGYLLYQRAKLLADGAGHHHDHTHGDHVHDHHVHSHGPAHDAPHVHSHGHEHAHAHTHEHPHTHAHEHEHAHHHHGPDGKAHSHVHSHGGKPHSHVPEGKVTIGSLIALGASGGLVPCPSALVLLLSAIALGRTALGLILLVGFSAGLAMVLMAIGALVIYAKHLLPEGRFRKSPAFRYVPVFSAVVVIVVGLLMTGVSLGWIHPSRMIG